MHFVQRQAALGALKAVGVSLLKPFFCVKTAFIIGSVSIESSQ